MDTYTITVKPAELKGDLSFYQVTASKAREVMARWDAHQNVQIGDAYISWQRIVEITAPPASNRIDSPKWCGKCEEGWTFREGTDPAYPKEILASPCKCNPRGQEEVRKYEDYLNTQSWYVRDYKKRERRLEQASLLLSADEVFRK